MLKVLYNIFRYKEANYPHSIPVSGVVVSNITKIPFDHADDNVLAIHRVKLLVERS